MTFVFPRSHSVWWALLSLKWLSTYLPVGSSKWIPWFALHSFFFTHETVLISTHDLSHFYLPDSIPHSTWAEQASGHMVLSCLPGLNHNTSLTHQISTCPDTARTHPAEPTVPACTCHMSPGKLSPLCYPAAKAHRDQGRRSHTQLWKQLSEQCWWRSLSFPLHDCMLTADKEIRK